MASICPLFSGSNGNSTYIEGGGARILVDAGVSGSRIEKALLGVGRNACELDGIFVTHEHTDHAAGVFVLARRYKIPVYATRGTWRAIYPLYKNPDKSLIRVIEPGDRIFVGDLGIEAFPIPHDAAEPVGYSFFEDKCKVTVATDIGIMNESLFLSIANSKAVLLESNHDVEMLNNGRYPYVLKKRIRGALGHLSNDEAAATCARLVSLGTRMIFLGHLSEENNRPDLAYNTVKDTITRSGAVVGWDVMLEVAERGVTGALVCV